MAGPLPLVWGAEVLAMGVPLVVGAGMFVVGSRRREDESVL